MSDAFRKRLSDELETIYTDAGSIRRILADAGIPISHIRMSEPTATIISDVIDEAEKQGKSEELIRAAIHEYGERVSLNQLLGAVIYPQYVESKPVSIPDSVDEKIDEIYVNAKEALDIAKSNRQMLYFLAAGLIGLFIIVVFGVA